MRKGGLKFTLWGKWRGKSTAPATQVARAGRRLSRHYCLIGYVKISFCKLVCFPPQAPSQGGGDRGGVWSKTDRENRPIINSFLGISRDIPGYPRLSRDIPKKGFFMGQFRIS